MSNFENQSRTADKFVIRLPDGMRDKIAGIAAGSRRSMNSEIILALHRHIDDSVAIPNAMPMAQNNDEVRMLEAFRHLSKEKKSAALMLLGGDK